MLHKQINHKDINTYYWRNWKKNEASAEQKRIILMEKEADEEEESEKIYKYINEYNTLSWNHQYEHDTK